MIPLNCKNRKAANTDQRRGLSAYRLLSVDYHTGRTVIESPRVRAPGRRYQYEVYLYQPPPGKRQCSCPGHARYGYCKHAGTDGVAWGLAWRHEMRLSPSAVGRSVYNDFMDARTEGEKELDFREGIGWSATDAAVYQVLWGGMA